MTEKTIYKMAIYGENSKHRATVDHYFSAFDYHCTNLNPYLHPPVMGVNYAIALGGDSMVMHVAKIYANREVPVIGINTGHLGFLAATTMDGISQIVDMLIDHQKGLDTFNNRRVCIEARYTRRAAGDPDDTQSKVAMNDVVIRAAGARMIKLIIELDGQHLTTTEGDGLIVATATGSTAYSLAAGGPIVWPEMDAVILTPLAPHAMNMRPIVVPSESRLTIRTDENSRGQALIIVDGRPLLREGEPMSRLDTLEIVQHGHTLVARPHAEQFGEIITSKLGWGGTLR